MIRGLPSAAAAALIFPGGSGKAADAKAVPLPYRQVKVSSTLAQRALSRRQRALEQKLATRDGVAAPERSLAQSKLIIEMYEKLDGRDKLLAKPPAGYEELVR
jgi:hypothetical protein